jgi:hypothetical protein
MLRHLILDPLHWSDLMVAYDPAFIYAAAVKKLYTASADGQRQYSLGIIDLTNTEPPSAFPYPETKIAWRSAPAIALSPDGERLYSLRTRLLGARMSPSSIPKGTVVNDLDASYDETMLITFDLKRKAFQPMTLPAENRQFVTDSPLLDWRDGGQTYPKPNGPFRLKSLKRQESWLVEPGKITREGGGQSTVYPIDPLPSGLALHRPILTRDESNILVPIGPSTYAPTETQPWILQSYLLLPDKVLKHQTYPSPRPIFDLKTNSVETMFFDNLGGSLQVIESFSLVLMREVAFDGEQIRSVYVVP